MFSFLKHPPASKRKVLEQMPSIKIALAGVLLEYLSGMPVLSYHKTFLYAFLILLMKMV